MKGQQEDLLMRTENKQGKILLKIDGAKAQNQMQATTLIAFGELRLVRQEDLSPF